MTPGNAFAAAVHGKEIPSWSEQLLPMIYDALQAVAFILKRGKGQRPKRLQRWWEKQKQQRLGSGAIPMSEFDSWWESAAKK